MLTDVNRGFWYSKPLPLFYRHENFLYTATAQYARGAIQAWTIGCVHPQAYLHIFDPMNKFIDCVGGPNYMLLEGIEPDVSVIKTQIADYIKVLRARGAGRWRVHHTDITCDELRELGGPNITIGLTEAEIKAKLQTISIDQLISAERHAPLRAKVEHLLRLKIKPCRIVVQFGVAHLENIERDVWKPLGFELVALNWYAVAKLRDGHAWPEQLK